MSYFRVNERCNGCLACVQNCPADALAYEDEGNKRKLLHNIMRCARCGNCWRVCPQRAVEFQHLLHGPWEEVVKMELVRCVVCGEPLYTADFGENLSEKVRRKVDPLCPAHRMEHPFSVWKKFSPDHLPPKEVET